MISIDTATLHPDVCADAPAPTSAYSTLEVFFNNGNSPLFIVEMLKEGRQHPFRRFVSWYRSNADSLYHSQELFNFESCGSFVGASYNSISHFVIKQFEADGKQCATTIYQDGD